MVYGEAQALELRSHNSRLGSHEYRFVGNLNSNSICFFH